MIEGAPGVLIKFLQAFRTHVLGLIHHLSGVVMIPVVVEDTALAHQVVVGLGVRERSQNGELGQVQIDLQEEVNQAEDVIFCLVVET